MFNNRNEAGRMLAGKLQDYRGTDAVVLAVPRGGLPVGYEIAKSLGLPLDIILAKKIGHPQNPEFAIGAVSQNNMIVDNYLDVTSDYIEEQATRIRLQLKEKEKQYKAARTELKIENKTVIVVDDGIATGNTLLVIIALLRKSGAAKIVVAVPALPYDKVTSIEETADELVYLMAPKFFPGVGAFYEEFNQVTDSEAVKILMEINQIKEHNKK